MKQKTKIITGALCLAALLFSHTVSASGTYGVSPANPSGEQPSWLVHDIGQGQTLDEQILVVNNGEEVASYALYAVDAKVSPEGAFLPGNEDSPKTQVAAWLELEKTSITLQPGEKKSVDVEFSIPKDAPIGKYAGAIMMQEQAVKSAATGGAGATIATRVGLRAYIDVVEPVIETKVSPQENLEKKGKKASGHDGKKTKTNMPLIIILVLAVAAMIAFMNKQEKGCCAGSCESKEKGDTPKKKEEESKE